MSISPADVRAVAKLAELDVEPAELGPLAEQLDRIVGYVGQLSTLGDAASAAPFQPGPAAAPLRPDRVTPIPLARRVDQLAPDFADGFFLVPRLSAMETE